MIKIKNIIKIIFAFFITIICFFYTNKLVKVARTQDPIMIKIVNEKNNYKVSNLKPVIKNNEITTGKDGCAIDINKSYSRMKELNDYDPNLLVFINVKNKKYSNKDYYYISGNKEDKKISINLIVDEKLDNSFYESLKEKNIEYNFFVDGYFLENNLDYIKKLKNIGNIYYYGRNNKYLEKYLTYDNNLIDTIKFNKIKYCLFDSENKKELKLCSKYNMKSIKTKIVNENIYEFTKNNTFNGKLFTYKNINNNVDEILFSINFFKTKGYSIVSLDELFSEYNNCK